MNEHAERSTSLREAIILEMHGKSWGLPKQGVLVKDGGAHLWGMIGSEEEKRAIHVAAENVPGIKRVDKVEFTINFRGFGRHSRPGGVQGYPAV